MNIAQLSIRRPVFVVMLMLFMVVFGLVSYRRLGMNMFPKVVFPFITVTTLYPGASPDVVESQVTKILEDSIAITEGIDRMSSYSMEGVSLVFVEFESDKDIDAAAQDVRDRVSQVLDDLPDDAEEPVVAKFDVNAMPILYFTVSSETMGQRELRDFVDKRIKNVIQQAPGVAEVTTSGGLEREIQVILSPSKLEAFGMSPAVIGQMLALSNVDFPTGSVKEGGLEYILRVPNVFTSVADISETAVASVYGKTVRLRDIATVIDSQKERKTDARLNSNSAILLSVIKRGDADLVSTTNSVKSRVAEITRELPAGISINLVIDYSKYVVASLEDINVSIVLGAILASLVVWLFVGKMRFTIPITVSILVAVIADYAAVNFAGFTLNFMSMLALAVAVGLIVDDSIVVQENILKEFELTNNAEEATIKGSSQVMLAVIASTSTIIAVFLPIAFMSGIIGQFFKEFGITISFAIGISTIVALTLIPLAFYQVSTRPSIGKRRPLWVKPIDFLSRAFDGIHKSFVRGYLNVEEFYTNILRSALKNRAKVVAGGVLFFLLSIPLFIISEVRFTPEMDRGRFQVFIELPVEAPLERTDEIVRQVERIVASLPEVDKVLSVIGMSFGGFMGGREQGNIAQVFGVLKDKRDRKFHLRWWGIVPVLFKYTDMDIVEKAREKIRSIPGAKISVSTEQMGGRAHPVELVFSDPDYQRLRRVTKKAQEILSSIKGAINVDNTERPGKLQLTIKPKIERMIQLGITPAELGQYLRILYEGISFSKYREGGEEYDITLLYPENERRNLQSVRSIKIISPRLNQPISLETIADINLSQGPSLIQHSDRVRSINVYADVAKGVGTGTVLAKWKAEMKEQGVIPSTTKVTPIGESDLIQEMFEQFLLALILGVIFSYMVLASQFNSYKHPLVIMMSVPLATTGSLLFIVSLGKSFNLMSFLGIVMLTGLVTKNSILLIDFANQARVMGQSIEDALVSAGRRRMRPILMTSFTTIFALLPVAFGLGEGADFRSPLAVAVIGGMVFSTLLTLIIIPVVYVIVENFSLARIRIPKSINSSHAEV